MADVLLLAFDTATAAVTVALHDGESVIAEHTEVDARRHGELLAPAIGRVLARTGRERRDLTGVAVGVGPGPFTGLRVGLVTARSLGDALGIPVHGVCSLDILAAAVAGIAPGPGAPTAASPQDTVSQSTVSQSTVSQSTVSQNTVSQNTVSQNTVSKNTALSHTAVPGEGAHDSAAAVSSADGDSADNASDVFFNAVSGDGAAFAVASDARRREVYWARYAADGRRITEPSVDRPDEVAALVAGLPVAGRGAALYPAAFPLRLEPELPSAAVLAELVVRRLATLNAELLPPLPLYLRRPDAAEPGARKPVSRPALR
jgi:tRNA threonylcarbamoyl adenosine modification protein YeaZ